MIRANGRNRPGSRPALTLLEVIVAMAIFSLALVALSRLLDIGTDLASQTRTQTLGTRLAQAKMAEVEAGVISLTSGGEGTFETEKEKDWGWSMESTPQTTPNLYQVTIKITHKKNDVLSLTQLMFDPTLVGSAAQAEATTSTPTTTSTVANPTTPTGGTSP